MLSVRFLSLKLNSGKKRKSIQNSGTKQTGKRRAGVCFRVLSMLFHKNLCGLNINDSAGSFALKNVINFQYIVILSSKK